MFYVMDEAPYVFVQEKGKSTIYLSMMETVKKVMKEFPLNDDEKCIKLIICLSLPSHFRSFSIFAPLQGTKAKREAQRRRKRRGGKEEKGEEEKYKRRKREEGQGRGKVFGKEKGRKEG